MNIAAMVDNNTVATVNAKQLEASAKEMPFDSQLLPTITMRSLILLSYQSYIVPSWQQRFPC